MLDDSQNNSMESWLESLKARFTAVAPQFLELFDIYAAEAKFGRSFIDSDLENLRPGAKILEVGAGSLLLSCQLMREGFDVTALEPVGAGFSHFDQMRCLVLLEAQDQGICPKILDFPAESLDVVDCYEYAFSINVMEHVGNVSKVLEEVGRSLIINASYHFTCPNYIFPYEPHFNIPTLFSKRLTEKLLGWKIFSSRTVPDPVGTWSSLNWINVLQIKKYVRNFTALKVTFNCSMLASTLERISSDEQFANRRSFSMLKLLSFLINLRIHLLFRYIPESLQPIMDCRVVKLANLKVI
jgi:hypothetical protein